MARPGAAQHRVGGFALLRLQIDVRIGVLHGFGDDSGDHREVQRQLFEHRDVAGQQFTVIGREDAQPAPALSGVQRQVVDASHDLVER